MSVAVSNKKKQFASLANYNLSLDEDDSKVCASGSLKTSERYPQYSVCFPIKLSIKEVIKIQFNFHSKSRERHCYLMVGAGFQNCPKQQWHAFQCLQLYSHQEAFIPYPECIGLLKVSILPYIGIFKHTALALFDTSFTKRWPMTKNERFGKERLLTMPLISYVMIRKSFCLFLPKP